MFLNYDSFEIVAIGFVVLGILTYSWSSGHFINNTTIKNESLVNTKSLSISPTHLNSDSNISTLNTTAPATHSPTLDSISNLPLVDIDLVDVGVQVDQGVQASSHVNTGMQTSARMWMQTIRDWINELLSSTPANPNYVDVGVQATPVLEHASRWQSFKDWVLDCFSIRSSEYSSIGMKGVDKWRNNLDSNQSLDLPDSESPLITLGLYNAEYESSLENLVNPNDSASNVSEVISEANLQNVNRIYDTSNPADLADLWNDSTIFHYLDTSDNNYYFHTEFNIYVEKKEIVEAVVEALLNSVN